MPKAIKKKIKKKSESEIEVQERLEDIKEALQKRQNALVRYGLAIFGVIAVIIAIVAYMYSVESKARQFEYDAYKIYYNEYQKTPMTEQERYKRALDLFKMSYEKKSTPRVLFYIASCYLELGRDDEALKTLNDLLQKYSNEKNLVPLVYKKIADIQIKKGNRTEAMKYLDMLEQYQGSIYKDVAMIESARLLEKEGKQDEAKKKYKQLAEKFPESPFIEEAREKLGDRKQP